MLQAKQAALAESERSWLLDTWYQACWSEDVVGGAPLVRTILDRPILFYRMGDGSVAVLLDRCPHRFAPLSDGTIAGDVVTCPYHGLAFGAAGECVRNPHGPITSRMRANAFPVIERHGAIWVWIGDGAADEVLLPDLSFIDATPAPAQIRFYMPTAANYELLVDNIMDLSHADYLHSTSLGGIMTGSKARSWEEGRTVVAEWLSPDCDPPPAFKAMVPHGRADIWTEVRWFPPALMVLGTAATPAGVARTDQDEAFTLHNMTPETATSTHYFVCSTRRFLAEDAGFSAFLGKALLHAFQNEDKPMLERQQARIGTSSFWELEPILLAVDAAAVQVRRKLARMIAKQNTPKENAHEARHAG